MSQRIGMPQWETAAPFERLLAQLLAHRSVVDEVALFDSNRFWPSAGMPFTGRDPWIGTGQMTAGAEWTTYSGQAFDRWFPALGATKARPGGGFYDDTNPGAMFAKALSCGRQRAALPAVRPLWEQWVTHADGLPTAAYNVTAPNVLAEIGLPLAADRPGCGVVLCGRIAEELKAVFAGGVLMDSLVLDVLTQRDLGHLAGVRLGQRLDNGLMERFTADALNGCADGGLRDARIEFWGDVLEPLGAGVRVLTAIEDYFNRTRGPGMTAFENELSGRVVVMGYAPRLFLHSVGKRLQLQNVADWISRGTMPVRVGEPVRLMPVARLSADRSRGAVMLVNAGLDSIREATVHLRMPASRARLLSPGRKAKTAELHAGADGVSLVLRDIEPWGASGCTTEG